MKEMMATGLTRYSLLNNEYYKNKGWLANHLYGKSWKECKSEAWAFWEIKPTMIKSLDNNITELKNTVWLA